MSAAPDRGDRVRQYEQSHRHPMNRACHVVGIPMITVSVVLALVSLPVEQLRPLAIVLFVAGWALQFIGHAFEGKPPEFLKDWRFLFTGLHWWALKVSGRV